MRVLSFGGGVDSSAILAYHLLEADLGIEHVVFADTGAESKATYANIDFFKGLCADAGLPFSIVAKDGENIVEWVTRLGIVPVMPGGSHVCSKKFKGDVIQKWINQTFPNEQITYLIGIEANEGHRTARFTKPAGDTNEYEYPLVDMGMDRDACLALLEKHNITVVKSSCVFCPFMSVQEIRDIRNNDQEAWDLIKTVEHRFSEESERKHKAWIDAGKPLNKGGRCNAGHWRKDSWAEGTRLFTKRVNGKQLSVQEWEALIDAEQTEQEPAAEAAATESVETPVATAEVVNINANLTETNTMNAQQTQQLELITAAVHAAGYLIRPLDQAYDFQIWMGKDSGRTLRFTLNVKGVPTHVSMDSVYGIDYTNAKARQTLLDLVDGYVSKMDHEQIGQMIEDVKAAEVADNGPDRMDELAAQIDQATVIDEITQGCEVLGLTIKQQGCFGDYKIEGCINGHYTLKFGLWLNGAYAFPRFHVNGESSIRYTDEDAVNELNKIREASALARRVAS